MHFVVVIWDSIYNDTIIVSVHDDLASAQAAAAALKVGAGDKVSIVQK